MKRKHIITAIVAALGLTACSNSEPAPQATVTVTESQNTEQSTSGTPTEGDPQPQTPPNPVTILKQVKNCTMEPGTEVGSSDVYGNKFASCDHANGDNVTVYGYQYPLTESVIAGYENLQPDDDHKIIIGDRWSLIITGRSITKDNLTQLAERLGGEVRQPAG